MDGSGQVNGSFPTGGIVQTLDERNCRAGRRCAAMPLVALPVAEDPMTNRSAVRVAPARLAFALLSCLLFVACGDGSNNNDGGAGSGGRGGGGGRGGTGGRGGAGGRGGSSAGGTGGGTAGAGGSSV